ncbi:uroporphyrinogen-III synthase [Arsenicicoccus dermatophilus]|uniref:uroporphyrinogen-III synthase n=1 Tax=Arsenicicoccus dermatophilus TaxID=1076331 RepID=UPI001F4C8013|nr:uroporphyrinogen-III synthase [Arsenicicoccus dermatophilus]MCH8613868.1 uroporphyrinogen-III synthase [Arsenicicoccus dermatophilus]
MRKSSTTGVACAPPAPQAAAGAQVAFVGTGPGDPGLLTLRAAELLTRADVVLLDRSDSAEIVRRHCRDDARIVSPPALAIPEVLPAPTPESLQYERVLDAIRSLDGGGLVVRLMSGDPGVFTCLLQECSALTAEGVPFEVVPGVTSLSAIPLYAGIPLTSPESPRLHLLDTSLRHDLGDSARDDVTVVMMGTPGRLVEQLSSLLEAGRDPGTTVALTDHGTTAMQHTSTTSLGDAAHVLDHLDDDAQLLAIVGRTVPLRTSMSWFENKPLFGWRVLVPRTKEQAGGITARLEHYGAIPTVVPTISIEPPRTPQQMDKAITGLVAGRYEWVGFTSVNAVRAVREKFDEYGLDVRSFAGLRVAAVGGATSAALREWGLCPDLVPSGEQSAAGLLEEWPPYDALLDPINRVFLPRADIATETLVAGLQDMGWEVEDVTAYRTVRAAPPAADVREAIKAGDFDAVVFTSSSTVRNLVGIAGKPHRGTVVACIGQATARTAEEHGLRVDVIAREASGESLVDGLAEFGHAQACAAYEAGEPVILPSKRRRRRRSS